MPRRKEPRFPDAILDQLLAGADAKTLFDPNGLLDDLKKALAERVLKIGRPAPYPTPSGGGQALTPDRSKTGPALVERYLLIRRPFFRTEPGL
jgi:hypothetical protein